MSVDQPLVAVEGRLICVDAAQMMTVLRLLPDHARLSRAEPGCLRFDIWQDDQDPLVWHFSELFVTEEAFAAHQTRGAASLWGRESQGIRRDVERRHVEPILRAETRADHEAISELLRDAFRGSAEVSLVNELRVAGDLHLSLVAEAAGYVLGMTALSPLKAEQPAVALAPVAVREAVQGRGIGSALVREALRRSAGHAVVAHGDVGFYRKFGFVPADLPSPDNGADLAVLGDPGRRIVHAPAFRHIL